MSPCPSPATTSGVLSSSLLDPYGVAPHLQQLADHGIRSQLGVMRQNSFCQFVPVSKALSQLCHDVVAGRPWRAILTTIFLA